MYVDVVKPMFEMHKNMGNIIQRQLSIEFCVRMIPPMCMYWLASWQPLPVLK